ncbi:MAG: helix-turn-helix domain-containing protein, partial [Candidatus Limnocylindria bacterium]
MVVSVIAPNRLRDERVAAGIDTGERLAELAGLDPAYYAHLEAGHLLPTTAELDQLLAALGGIAPKRLYAQSFRQMLAVEGYGNAGGDFAEMFEQKRGAARLLVARDEVTWLDRRPLPDRKIDVFLSMSCGTQESPHLLLDT